MPISRPVLRFQPITGNELSRCAAMMMNTTPWNILEFTTDICLAALQMPRVEVVGTYRGEVLEGFIAMLSEGIEFEPMIVFLCVDEEFRNQGIGTVLLEYFEERFEDVANLYLFVADVNTEVVRLYERNGYLRVGILPNFKLVGQTEFLYRKSRRSIISSVHH